MIVNQSPAIAESQNHLTVIPPLPAGEGRGEGESFEVELSATHDEGELRSRGRQPALIKVGRVSPLTAVVMEVYSVHSVQTPPCHVTAPAIFHVVPRRLCKARRAGQSKTKADLFKVMQGKPHPLRDYLGAPDADRSRPEADPFKPIQAKKITPSPTEMGSATVSVAVFGVSSNTPLPLLPLPNPYPPLPPKHRPIQVYAS
jgi:hypothetical protein